MRIAVIGAGNIGRTLGGKWTDAGHDVVYGVRRPGEPGTATVANAVASAEVVVLAVPGAAAKEVIASLGSDLVGKVVVDATNDVQGWASCTRSTSSSTAPTPCARSIPSAGRTSPTP
jgi:predicted dinucleotide-binding enzyme